jgi:hypothetical protein
MGMAGKRRLTLRAIAVLVAGAATAVAAVSAYAPAAAHHSLADNGVIHSEDWGMSKTGKRRLIQAIALLAAGAATAVAAVSAHAPAAAHRSLADDGVIHSES